MNQPFDRGAEDLGNSIHLEHVNVQVPDQRLATLFYVAGLGLTRDPYLMVSDSNMWVNVGRSQFHLPSGEAQVLRGHTGLVISGRNALLDRLASGAQTPTGHSRSMTATTCRCISRTSPALTASCRRAALSTVRIINTNTAFAISSISPMASTCSPSSTRCAAPPTRCI